MLVGSRPDCAHFIEWFAGAKLTSVGTGTEANVTVVRAGKDAHAASGDDAAAVVGADAQHLLRVPNLGAHLRMEQVSAKEKRSMQMSFILTPAIQGAVPDSDLDSKTAAAQALDDLRAELQGAANLEQVFSGFDAAGSGHISLDGFEKALVKLQSRLAGERAQAIFKALDMSGHGVIDHAQLVAAIKQRDVTYGYDLDSALEAAAQR
jgi:hypothetical protein